MNKFIFDQLKKCKIAQLPEYDENTTHIIIPKVGSKVNIINDLNINQNYLIIVEEYIIKPYNGFTLHDNWNNGIIPTDKQMEIKVEQIMGKMVKVSAVGYNDRKPWNGWLPRKSIHILKEL